MPTEKDTIIELQAELLEKQKGELDQFVQSYNVLTDEVKRLREAKSPEVKVQQEELIKVIETQKAQIDKLMQLCESLANEVQILKQPVRASTDHDKIRKKGKVGGRNKRWQEAVKEEEEGHQGKK